MDELTLLDWKRRVSALYAEVRTAREPERAWQRWRTARDDLFARHPQSPLPVDAREPFDGLDYFGYDRALHVLGPGNRLAVPVRGGERHDPR